MWKQTEKKKEVSAVPPPRPLCLCQNFIDFSPDSGDSLEYCYEAGLPAFPACMRVGVRIDRWLSLYESWFAHSCNGGRETSQTYVVDSRTR